MADKKISQLTGASTPLAGTEVLPIVQSGSTVKVAVSDLTAGRTVTASGVNVSGLTASQAVATDASKNLVSIANTGTGNNVLQTSPTITTPTLSGSAAIGATIIGGNNAAFAYYKGLSTGAEWLVGPLNSTNSFEWKNETADKYLLQLSNTGNLKCYEGNFVVGTSGKGIIDTNGNESMLFTATASAVNELTVANAATGSNPAISSTGGDTNIGLRLNTKGSGPLSINGPLNRFVASGTNADTTVAATISFVSQSTDWISQLIEFQVALSSTAGSSVHGGVVRYILSSLDSGTGLASVTALASDLTGVTAATSVSGNNLTVTFTITGGGNCNRYGISAEVLSSNGAGWWASGMTVA